MGRDLRGRVTRAYRAREYPLWLCPDCGCGVSSLHWGRHVRAHRGIAKDTRCDRCWDFVPCRKKGDFVCPNHEPRIEVDAEQVPDVKVVRSLRMQVSRTKDGRWKIRAPWLRDAVIGDTWPDTYWMATKKQKEHER